ncbi:M1 family metallopeptidase [Amycolatopsis rhabdoformis]|uniref:Aminopeptidase N n=1 Tax=Amycolatopsis rhabdoformis TaxID=1448059 RepID=A0ABZ1HXE3_9PSEU|nr:M1 family metallopeptidase [Amycolatopsis rhabdoformis]WSE26048.1 M1 family metallopeptidase [Amycolatopsis rhabdoformis]
MVKTIVKTAAVASLAAVLAAGTATAAPADPAAPGALSAGERLFPGLGNGGYDARDYDVSLDYRPGVTTMAATVTMRAVATQSLSSFGLDSAVARIDSVEVDGAAAEFTTQGEKLVVTPARPLRKGVPFTVRIGYLADRAKSPQSPATGVQLPPDLAEAVGVWQNTPDGFAVMGQTDREHAVFPSDDVPGDPATYTLRIATPADVQGVGSGTLVGKHRVGDRVTSVFRVGRPTATDVVQFAAGHFTEVDQVGPHGLPVRSYVTTAAKPAALDTARETPGIIAWLEQRLGRPYPYASAGTLGVNRIYGGGVALETAAMPTYSALSLEHHETVSTMAHELTHEYFGDAVPVRHWDDMWLSEGHATYYQDLYDSEHGGTPFDEKAESGYAQNNEILAQNGPVAHQTFPTGVMFGTDLGGKLTLYALRGLVGQATFDRIERTFFDEFQGRPAATQDYVAVAERVSGRDLGTFFHDWLYGSTTPAMPGHPEWKA